MRTGGGAAWGMRGGRWVERTKLDEDLAVRARRTEAGDLLHEHVHFVIDIHGS